MLGAGKVVGNPDGVITEVTNKNSAKNHKPRDNRVTANPTIHVMEYFLFLSMTSPHRGVDSDTGYSGIVTILTLALRLLAMPATLTKYSEGTALSMCKDTRPSWPFSCLRKAGSRPLIPTS